MATCSPLAAHAQNSLILLTAVPTPVPAPSLVWGQGWG